MVNHFNLIALACLTLTACSHPKAEPKQLPNPVTDLPSIDLKLSVSYDKADDSLKVSIVNSGSLPVLVPTRFDYLRVLKKTEPKDLQISERGEAIEIGQMKDFMLIWILPGQTCFVNFARKYEPLLTGDKIFVEMFGLNNPSNKHWEDLSIRDVQFQWKETISSPDFQVP